MITGGEQASRGERGSAVGQGQGQGQGQGDGYGQGVVLDARRRLVGTLGEIADTATARSLERCPYRTADDACTFHGDCRNQGGLTPGVVLCNGTRLNPEPAAPNSNSNSNSNSSPMDVIA